MLYLFGMWENGSRGDGIQNRKGDWVQFPVLDACVLEAFYILREFGCGDLVLWRGQ